MVIIYNKYMNKMNIVETYHPNLLKYKDKHKGETCYIFGSGPSLNLFKIKEPGVFIGCNHIIKHKYIRDNLKYYFFGHGYPHLNRNNDSVYGNHQKEVDNLGNHIEKFAMVSRNNDLNIHGFTKEMITNLHKINAIPCDINITNYFTDLHEKSFMNHSIVLLSLSICIIFRIFNYLFGRLRLFGILSFK